MRRRQAIRLLNPCMVEMAGNGVLSAIITERLLPTLTQSFAITASVIFLAFLVVFRSPAARLMTMIPSFFAILSVFIVMRVAGIPLNIATILIGSTVLGATENDQVHFFYHLQEGRSSGTHRGCAQARDAHRRPADSVCDAHQYQRLFSVDAVGSAAHAAVRHRVSLRIRPRLDCGLHRAPGRALDLEPRNASQSGNVKDGNYGSRMVRQCDLRELSFRTLVFAARTAAADRWLRPAPRFKCAAHCIYCFGPPLEIILRWIYMRWVGMLLTGGKDHECT